MQSRLSVNTILKSVVVNPLRGRTALITGSGRNIGKAIALRLARAGANIVVNGSRDGGAIDRVVNEVQALGVKAIGIKADVGDCDAVSAMVEEAIQAFGSVDIAISVNGCQDPHKVGGMGSAEVTAGRTWIARMRKACGVKPAFVKSSN